MVESTGTGEATASAPPSRRRELALYAAAWIAGAVPLFLVITALWLDPGRFGSTGTFTIGAFAVVFPVMVFRLGVPRNERFVWFLLLVGVVFGIVSVLTGAGNGLTDEPFTTPRFVTLLWARQDPYVVPLVFNYVQYGQTIHSASIYPYLPLLMFLQIPGLDYKWLTLACWVGMVLLVRKQVFAGVLLAQPYVATMAASGYNDFPVLLLLTVAFVGLAGRRQRWAQLLALGAKQFANAVVVVYYIVKRDWKNVLVTVGVSVAFILPFVLWSGPTVLCPTVFANRLASCPSGGSPTYLLNYALWVVWPLAVFYPSMVRAVRASAQTGRLSRVLAGRPLSVEDLLRAPSLSIVGISGALAGVSAFLASGIYLGSAPWATLASAGVGFLLLGGWLFAWNGIRSAPVTFLGRPLSGLSCQAVVQSIALALNVATVAGATLVGRPAVEGEIAGAFLASLWESAVIFQAQRGRFPREMGPLAGATARSGPA